MKLKPHPAVPKSQSGAALVVALLMMIVITLIGLASSSSSIFEVKLAGNGKGFTSAFYAAESGVQATTANTQNFNLDGRYVDNKYDPFTDPNNSNPTKAKVTVTYDPTQQGAPRGLGFSAAGNFEFNYYVIESTGQDQVDLSLMKSACTIEEKVVRLIPTIQGGY